MPTGLLLARYAGCLFWMSRYVERAENLARILDITEVFGDSQGGRNWLSVVQINADVERFKSRYADPTPGNVKRFYILDRDNPTSLTHSVAGARENARTVRSIISTEMWAHMNMFHNRVADLRQRDLAGAGLSTVCRMVKEACQAQAGIADGTLYRDQGWHFHRIGRLIERADQTTRLIDVKYHLLLPSPGHVGTALDASQWFSLLRAAAGYQAFRRTYPGGMSPEAVAGFLLMNEGFPRSVLGCVRDIEWHLNTLRSRFGLRGKPAALEALDELRSALANRNAGEIIAGGLHEFLDWSQGQLMAVTEAIGRDFFD